MHQPMLFYERTRDYSLACTTALHTISKIMDWLMNMKLSVLTHTRDSITASSPALLSRSNPCSVNLFFRGHSNWFWSNSYFIDTGRNACMISDGRKKESRKKERPTTNVHRGWTQSRISGHGYWNLALDSFSFSFVQFHLQLQLNHSLLKSSQREYMC